MSIEICHVCDGYGHTDKITCQRCEGSGRLMRTKTYETLSSHGIEHFPYAEIEALAWKMYDDNNLGVPDAPRWTSLNEEAKNTYRSQARAAIAAPRADAGYVLVPREPTYEMAEAAKDISWPERRTNGTRHPSDVHDAALDCYRAMIAALPVQS